MRLLTGTREGDRSYWNTNTAPFNGGIGTINRGDSVSYGVENVLRNCRGLYSLTSISYIFYGFGG